MGEEEMVEEGGREFVKETFVTFKWLIATMISTLAIAVSVIAIVSNLTTKTLDAKVNKEAYAIQYNSLCNDLDQIKTDLKANGQKIDIQGRNQELVLRALKIEPVRHP